MGITLIFEIFDGDNINDNFTKVALVPLFLLFDPE